ncbi:fimbrial protein [Stenotrophomonas sp. PD6]|uniref:fimbrial protein n=1 Tax=Stenotrophomonas sp. PD6 TaxID=3368612 RepID=UPI003B9DEAD6
MKKHILGTFVLLTVGAFAAQTASASDGTITFTGAVTSQTCDIDGNGGGVSDFEVALPTVSIGTLAGTGSTAGATPFTIKLTNCTPGTGNVHTYFEPGALTNAATGNLALEAGGAVDVEIGIFDNSTKIMMGATDADQSSPAVALVGGAASINYIAKYVSVADTVSAGAANSHVAYTIVYE